MALIVLAAPLDARLVAPIPPRLEASPRAEEDYSAVGYGATEGDGDDAGLRRRRDALRVLCVGGGCSSGQVDEAEWRGDHGVCNGDSGGPAIDRRGFVIGVTSRGPSGCEQPIYGGLVGARPVAARRRQARRPTRAPTPAPPGRAPAADLPRDAPIEAPARAAAGCAVAAGARRPWRRGRRLARRGARARAHPSTAPPPAARSGP